MKKSTQEQLDHYLEHELDPAFARRARLLVYGLDLKGTEHVLEIGCGRGYYEGLLSFLYPKLRITAIDMSQTYLEIARRSVASPRVTFIHADGMNLPWKNNTFDRVFATEVLEHLPDDEKGIAEMYRVLKAGGRAVVTVPNKHYPFLWDPLNWMLERLFHTHVPKDIWWLAGIWADHERLYTKKELVQRIEAAKFFVRHIFFSTRYCFPFSHFLLYGIGKNIVERGLLSEFYRFMPENNPSLFFWLIHSLLYLFDKRNTASMENKTSVTIVAVCQKK